MFDVCAGIMGEVWFLLVCYTHVIYSVVSSEHLRVQGVEKKPSYCMRMRCACSPNLRERARGRLEVKSSFIFSFSDSLATLRS